MPKKCSRLLRNPVGHVLLAWAATVGDVVLLVISTVEQIKWEEAQPTRYSEETPSRTLEQLRGQERTAREALAKWVAVELRHRIRRDRIRAKRNKKSWGATSRARNSRTARSRAT